MTAKKKSAKKPVKKPVKKPTKKVVKKPAKKVVKKPRPLSKAKPKKAAKDKPLASKAKAESTSDISFQFMDRSVVVSFPSAEDKTVFLTKTVPIGTSEYDAVKQAIKDGKRELLPSILIEKQEKLKKAVKNVDGFEIHQDTCVVMIDVGGGELRQLPAELAARIMKYAQEDLPLSDLRNFAKNMFQNPSNRSLISLFRFLEANHFTLTSDGCFIAYKGVQDNFTDYRTGKFDNSIGNVVKITRNMVDENIEQTCSYGLHVASYKYAHNFGNGNTVVEVKVNPRDVVAVPLNETDEKMRVCEYKVIGSSYVERTEIRTDDYGALYSPLSGNEYEDDDDDDDIDDDDYNNT